MFLRKTIVSIFAAVLVFAGAASMGRAAAPSARVPPPGQTAEAAGILLETLDAEDLNDLQAQFGKRLGVGVNGVRPGTPGEAAGLKEGDIITAVNGAGVDSAARAAALLRAATGEVRLTVLAVNVNTLRMESKSVRLQMGGGTGGPRPSAAAPSPAPGESRPVGGDPVEAYFNLMDFACSQAWSRTVATPAQDRRRVSALLQQGWGQMDAQTQARIMTLPKAWSDLQQSWQAMGEAERNRKRTEWRDQILLPNNFFAPPAPIQSFTAQGNLLSFEYPASWTGGWQEIQGTPCLFVGPGGAQASWDKVLNTQTSPAGAFFALVTITDQMRQMSYAQAARALVQVLMPGAAASFREVQVIPIGHAGVILVLRGKFPGESEERFYWIGVTAFGSGQVFAGRMGGRISQAMDLLPGFHHMLSTLKLNPPAASSGGGSALGSWEVAWSKVSTAAVANIWK